MGRQMAVPVRAIAEVKGEARGIRSGPKEGADRDDKGGVVASRLDWCEHLGDESASALELSGRRGQVGSRNEVNQRRMVRLRLVIEERTAQRCWGGGPHWPDRVGGSGAREWRATETGGRAHL
jgi:hypothetical protein